jgi:hypothetical protein
VRRDKAAFSSGCKAHPARTHSAIAVTVAVIEPVAAALVAAGADQAFDVGLHQDLQYRLGDGSQEIAIAALLQQLDKRHSLFGHRVLRSSGPRWLLVVLATPP